MRNTLIRNGIILAGALCAMVQRPSVAAEVQRQPAQPNIIILLVDDLGYGDLSSYGHPSIETPALDRLAAEGQRWTDFYATTPICSPTRGALMTGKLPVRSGLYGVEDIVFWPNAKGGIPAEELTIAEALKQAGYDTAIIGKWHLGDKADALPTRHGFDRWFGTPYSNDMDWLGELPPGAGKKHFVPAVLDPNRKSSDWGVPLIDSYKAPSGYVDEIIERPTKQETLTKRYTERAVSFIEEHAASDRPFFLYVAYNMPHIPIFVGEEFKGKSLGGTYGDAVEEIDWSAKEIRHALEKAGVAENTLLVFTSDNGAGLFGTVGPFKGRKGTTFEGGVRVPGIFWWPGRIKPGVVHGVGSSIDLYATALSLAGMSGALEESDSIDLSPVFEGRSSPRDYFAYYSWKGQFLGYRKGAWKVSFTEDGFTPSNKYKLYNLQHEPTEIADLSERYPGMLEKSEMTDLSGRHPDVLEELVDEARKYDAAIPRAEPIFDQ